MFGTVDAGRNCFFLNILYHKTYTMYSDGIKYKIQKKFSHVGPVYCENYYMYVEYKDKDGRQYELKEDIRDAVNLILNDDKKLVFSHGSNLSCNDLKQILSHLDETAIRSIVLGMVLAHKKDIENGKYPDQQAEEKEKRFLEKKLLKL
jgi:hypothetical protein